MPYTLASEILQRPLCAKEAATLLGYRYRHFLGLYHQGKLGSIRGWQNVEGGQWQFDRLEVLLFIEQRKAEAAAKKATASIRRPEVNGTLA